MVFQLTDKLAFPDPHYGDPDGLLAVGGDLSIDRLILAYSNGIFPLVRISGRTDTMVVPDGPFRHLSGRNPYLPLHAYAHQQRKVRNHLQRSFPRHHTNLRRIADRTRRRLARNEDDGSLYAPARTRIRRQRGSMGRRAIGRWAVRSDPGTLFLWREHVLTRSQRLEAGPHPSGPILQGTWRRHDRLPVRNPSPQNNGRQAHQLRRIYDIHRTRLPLLKVKRNNEGLRTIRA